MAETVGSLVDKLSIIQLKIYHMTLQTKRPDAGPEHVQSCERKLAVLNEQRNDLAKELSELSEAVLRGERTMKVYRQFKMYNDPMYRTGGA